MRVSFFYRVYTLHLVLRIPFENFAVSEYQNNLLIFIFVVVALHLCCCPQTFSSCSCGAQASPSSGFSCCRAQALGHTGLAALQHVESFQTRDVSCIGRWILIYGTTRKVKNVVFYEMKALMLD